MKKAFNFDFMKHRNHFFMISGAIFLIGIIFNFINPPQLDIKFTGGAILKYSYSGAAAIDPNKVDDEIEKATGKVVTTSATESATTTGDADRRIVISFNEKKAVDKTVTDKVDEGLKAAYPDLSFKLEETNSVDPTMGGEFLLKCIVAVLLAVLFMVLYVAIRFRKIGGISAGVSGILAIVHDIIVVYFVFVIFGYPLDDNFIAAVLAIIGFSLNDTIVIFDRIRENRRLLGPKATVGDIANASINQTLGRTIYTSVCVFLSVLVMAIIAVVYGVDSVVTFAIPMMFGVVSGSYSTICISIGIWAIWNEKYPQHATKKRKSK
ncbi:MAG: protein translocase subunit SecF [Oscillospiraceae bacterium]|jgi:preprotein translocase subunit SecF|nr:protein translocase subunit SecF [Oscillospiraceae bacterium]